MHKMKISEQVKRLREKAKMTQRELADRAGVGLRFIRDLEQGKQTVRSDKVNQVLALFGYHLEALKDHESDAHSKGNV
jgi:y4mF family transcriptional regulator